MSEYTFACYREESIIYRGIWHRDWGIFKQLLLQTRELYNIATEFCFGWGIFVCTDNLLCAETKEMLI